MNERDMFTKFFEENYKDQPGSELKIDDDKRAFVVNKDGFIQLLRIDEQLGTVYIK